MSEPVKHFINGEAEQRDHIASLLDAEKLEYKEHLPFMAGFFQFSCTPEVAVRLREQGLTVVADFKLVMIV